eukprot:3148910-Prymnesium_polylepis.1
MRKALRLMTTTLSSCYPIAASKFASFDGAAFIETNESGGDSVDRDGRVNADGAGGNEGARRGALPPH